METQALGLKLLLGLKRAKDTPLLPRVAAYIASPSGSARGAFSAATLPVSYSPWVRYTHTHTHTHIRIGMPLSRHVMHGHGCLCERTCVYVRVCVCVCVLCRLWPYPPPPWLSTMSLSTVPVLTCSSLPQQAQRSSWR